MAQLNFLGTGFSFPFRLSAVGGLKKTVGVSISSDVELVNASLKHILTTLIGERPMLRDFGCSLRNLVFEPNDPILDVRIDFFVQDCISKWEPRIILGDLSIDRRERKNGVLILSITYTIIKSNVEGNLVFPFYLEDVTSDSTSSLVLKSSPN